MPKDRKLLVPRNHGVPDYEKHMEYVIRHPDTILKLPRTISHAGALGRSVSLVQLIATWANSSNDHRVETWLNPNDRNGIERFVSHVHGLTAAYFANSITTQDGQTNLRRALLESATPRILAMSKRRYECAAKGSLTELIFVHHASHQFHSAVYEKKPNTHQLMDPQTHGELIVGRADMNALLTKILIAQNLPRDDFTLIKPLLDNYEYPLGTMLHEAFRNTAEHAYLDLEGRIQRKGLRCILIAQRSINPDELRPESLVSTDHPGLDSYFGSIRDRAGKGLRRQVHLLELSVVDTGPGFLATMDSHMTTPESDADRVSRCFLDSVSSKPGPNSGLGLGLVLSAVHQLQGFVRLRTSSTEAFFSSMTDTSKSVLLPHVAGDLPNATGTVLTVGIPLETF